MLLCLKNTDSLTRSFLMSKKRTLGFHLQNVAIQ